MKSGAILGLEWDTKKLVLSKGMERQIKEWVEHHLPSKTNEDLWDLQAAILTELSRRDDVQYRVRASKESLNEKFREIGVI